MSKTQVVHVFECHIRGSQVENWWVSKGPNTFCPLYIIENYRTLYLVGGFEHFLFFHILGMSSSQLTHSYFSEGQVYHQPVQKAELFRLVQYYSLSRQMVSVFSQIGELKYNSARYDSQQMEFHLQNDGEYSDVSICNRRNSQ